MTWSRAGLSALLVVAALSLAAIVTAAPASGAPAACGFRVGPIFPDRGAGNGGFDVSLIPDVPSQSCTVTVAATAVITLPGGGRPSNVGDNPSAGAVTVTFSPLLVAPRVSWQWRPFCSDPPMVVFTATVGGSTESVAVGANSCQSFGGSSTLLAPTPFPVPAQPAYTGLAATPSSAGIWAAQADGAVKVGGDATNLGAPTAVAAPVVGLARTPSGHGYWLVGSDGGIFTFGDARFFGSTGAMHLNAPVVGMAATPDGGGYWLVAADGGIFTFGDAHFRGSTGAVHLNAPVVGMAATPDGGGYWLVAADGGIFTFGDAAYGGSGAASGVSAPVTGVAATHSGKGYWVLVEDGNVLNFGDAPPLQLH